MILPFLVSRAHAAAYTYEAPAAAGRKCHSKEPGWAFQTMGIRCRNFPFRTAHCRNCYARTKPCSQMQKEIAREVKLSRDARKQTEPTHNRQRDKEVSKASADSWAYRRSCVFFVNDLSMRTGIAWLHYNRTAPWVHTPVQQSCRMARQWAAHP